MPNTEDTERVEAIPAVQELSSLLEAATRDALKHLYDFPYLEASHLVAHGPSSDLRPGETSGQSLRRHLLTAIEALNPEPSATFLSPDRRVHNLLHLHYIEGATIVEAAHELSISRRQAYRDLRKGEKSVALLLQSRGFKLADQSDTDSDLVGELEHMGSRYDLVDIVALLQDCLRSVARLASQHGIQFAFPLPSEAVTVMTDKVHARQVITSILSHAIQRSLAGEIALTVATRSGEAVLSIRYSRRSRASEATVPTPLTAKLSSRLLWTVKQRGDSEQTVEISMPSSSSVVLVVDDNEGLADLLTRYLDGQPCSIISAGSGEDGLSMASKIAVDTIILDIMMPGMDGWQVLQELRANPRTAGIPVIICSVVNDRELAHSLGASRVLSKPVDRGALMHALQETGVL